VSAVLGLLISIAAGSDPAFPELLARPRPDVGRQLAPSERRKAKEDAGVVDLDGETLPQSNVVTIRRRIIIRIPLLPPVMGVPAAPGRSAKRGVLPLLTGPGPQCISQRLIQGATISERNGVIIMTAKSRYQARLERACRPADFQSGFYINPTADGEICAGRDLLHARSGANCLITRFSAIRGER
jgi:hypothetical protein